MKMKREKILGVKLDPVLAETKTETGIEIQCASCQEPIEVDKFNERPFM